MKSQSPVLQQAPDFSLVLGGPLHQMYLRSHNAQPPLGLLHRRISRSP